MSELTGTRRQARTTAAHGLVMEVKRRSVKYAAHTDEMMFDGDK